jgi:amino acid transporter
MYMLMFASAIKLRYTLPKMERPFRLGAKGNGLMWLLGGLGFCGSLLAFVLSFIPPSQIAVGSNTVWYAVLIIGAIVFVVIPYIIYAMRKPSWKAPDANIEKFEWEK